MAKDFAELNRLEHEAGIQAPETSQKDELVSKFVKAWENQTARRVAKGGTGLTMALTLAACGGSSGGVVSTSGETDGEDTTTVADAISAVFTDAIDVLNGDSGDDTFRGDANTVSAADLVDGGAGTDTFNYFDAAAAVVLPELSNVEVLNIHSPAAATTALDVTNVTGLTNLNFVNYAIGGNSLAGIAVESDVTFGLQNVTQTGANAITVDFGTATTANVSLDDAQVRTLNADGDDVTAIAIDSTGDTANSLLAIASTGDEETLTITGAQDLTITNALAASVVTVNASAATGSVAVEMATVVTASDDAIAFTGGAGDDTLTLGTQLGTVDADATVALNGGDGTDILAVSSQIDTDVTVDGSADITNFEVLQIDANVAYDLDGYDWVEQVNVNADIAAANVIDNIAAGVTINLLVDTTSISLSHEDEGAVGTQTQLVDIGGDAAVAATLLDIDGVENITVNSSGEAANTISALTADAVRTLTVTGDQDLTITELTDIADSIEASAFTGDLDIDLAEAGGAGAAQATAIEINLGSGDDTVTHDTAALLGHEITTGDGSDTIEILNVDGGATETLANRIKVTDFTVGDTGDTLELDGDVAAAIVTDAELEDIQTAVDALAAGSTVANALTAAIGAFTGAADDVYHFEFGGSTFVVYEDGADATAFDDGVDFVIELTGTTDFLAADNLAL
jgi:hypothetical protein